MKVLSVNKVLDEAGGAAKLQELLYRAGQPYPSLPRISMWKARNSIPGWWAGAIIYAFACKKVNPLRLLAESGQ